MSGQKNYKDILNIIFQQIFGIFLIGYLFFFLIDQIFDNFVSNFINLNYILAIVIISGILLILIKDNDDKLVTENQEKNSWKFSILAFFLGLIAAILIFVKIMSLGIVLSIIISILSGVLIWLISYLLLDNSQNDLK
ncbi:MAG: hypothetical protein WC663_02785 [Patescibacteria group bacterium]